MSRDLRQYSRQTNVRLIIGFIILLFIVGDGLIYWFYGQGAALFGLVCIMAGLVPIGLSWLAIVFIGWLTKKLGGDE
jgi:hypothetical protein